MVVLKDKQHGKVAIPDPLDCYKIEYQGWMECCEHTVIRMTKHEKWSLSIQNALEGTDSVWSESLSRFYM